MGDGRIDFEANGRTTSATQRARVLGLGTWLSGAILFAAACLERSPVLFGIFGAWYVVLAVVVFATVVASRRSQVALARANAIRFRELAIRDDLTGLYNRRYFTAELERQVAASRAAGEPLTLAVLDLDGFKSINDSLGHAGGDVALHAAARVIAESCPPGATAARIGGDEFAVILPGLSLVSARHFSARLRQALGQAAVPFEARQIPGIGATIGVASLEGRSNAGELLREADAELYAGKRAPRAA